jgi:hypothetical protein
MYLKIFEDLANNNSTKFKKKYLEDLKGTRGEETLKQILFLTLNPQINFYIKKIPEYTPSESDFLSLCEAMNKLNFLSDRKVTGRAGTNFLKSLLESVSSRNAKILEKIINRDLNCGVSFKTVNSVWKKLIPEYPCMLCASQNEKSIKNIKFPAYAQEKSDGARFNAIVRSSENIIEYRSRNGNVYHLFDHLKHEFFKLADGKDVVFDGEALCWDKPLETNIDDIFDSETANENEFDILDRQTTNGILNKSVQGTISKSEAQTVFINLWDMIPLKDFEDNELCEIAYEDRFNSLKEKLELDDVIYKNKIQLIDTEFVHNEQEMRDFYKKMVEKGKEGAIIKNINGKWENKRSNDAVKMKEEFECDLRVTGFIPHKKKEGWIGSLVCESSCSQLKTKTGSGMREGGGVSNLDRTIDPNFYLDKIVRVKYNAVINRKGEDLKSLFLPIIQEVRFDKDEADSLTKIEGK